MIIRGGETLFRSEEQQHSFNYPFQLGPVSKDTPKDTQSFVIKILPGDIIIMGSDGLFDNVFDDEIVDICISKADQNIIKSDPQLMADALLKKAREIAEDSRYASSPFQNRAVKEGLYYQGGKIDDMTILVSIIRFILLILEKMKILLIEDKLLINKCTPNDLHLTCQKARTPNQFTLLVVHRRNNNVQLSISININNQYVFAELFVKFSLPTFFENCVNPKVSWFKFI